jgi:hypothetical protein
VENRRDLSDILFSGLAEGEADHIRAVIRQSDADLLARKRAQDEPLDLTTGAANGETDDTQEDALAS